MNAIKRFTPSVFVLFFILLLTSQSVFSATTLYSWCYEFSCYDSAAHKYQYNQNQCYKTTNPLGADTYDYQISLNNPSGGSISALNTNVQGGTWPTADEPNGCRFVPYGCNQGLHANSIPTCSGGTGGGGGGGCAPECNANGPQCTALSNSNPACPVNWRNRQCADVPCAYRTANKCGCTTCENGCSPSCTGGGGCTGSPTPTPTPTPTPYCTAQCPGTPISEFDSSTLTVPNAAMGIFAGLGTGSGAGDANGGGTGGSINGTQTTRMLAQSAGGGGAGGTSVGGSSMHSCGEITQALATDPNYLTFGYGEVRGDLTYNGYIGHTCSSIYDCPVDSNGTQSCPVPTVVVQAPQGNGTVAGAYTTRLGLGSMLKNFTQKLLAQSVGGGGGGSITGSHTTWTKSEVVNRLNGSTPTLYGYTVKGSTGQSCSCQIVLGCQQSQQASPNSEEMMQNPCESQCTFSVDSTTEYPEVGDTVIFSVDANDGFDRRVSMDYDDESSEFLSDPYPAVNTHTFTNAGTYDVTLSCSNPAENGKTCTRRLNVYCAGTGVLLTPTPTPPPSWTKFKDTSVTIQTAITNTAPSGALAYDSSDTGVCDRANPTSVECISSGQGGMTTVHGASSNFGVRLSDRQWLRTDPSYASNELITPDSFIEYARARKDVVDLQSVSAETIQPGKINIFTGNLVISDNALPDSITAGEKVVIVVDGTLSFDLSTDPADTFNPDNKPIAFITTGTTEISAGTTEMNGIFISNVVNFAYDATPSTSTPLKINGNLSYLNASTACSDKRDRTDSPYKPSCFFTFDFANQYLPLIDLLSTRTYEWTELVP